MVTGRKQHSNKGQVSGFDINWTTFSTLLISQNAYISVTSNPFPLSWPPFPPCWPPYPPFSRSNDASSIFPASDLSIIAGAHHQDYDYAETGRQILDVAEVGFR